jgi:integrase
MRFSGKYEDRVADLKRLLHTRLRLHEWEGRDGAAAYWLDLRMKHLRGGRMTVCDPRDPEWPRRGSTTTDLSDALRWVDEYVDRLGLGYCAPGAAQDLIGSCAIRYLAALEETKGRGSSTFRNRTSAVRVHILPALEQTFLLDLTAARVQIFVNNLETVGGGAPAEATREGVLAALTGIWRTAFPTSAPPWAGGITINGEDPGRGRRERAIAGIRIEDVDGYTPDELKRILVGAYAMDLYRAGHPRRRYGMMSVVDHVAFLVHHAVRAEESVFEREKDIDRKRRVIRLIGTKSAASEERWMPIQAAYEPWLDRALARCASPEDFLLPSPSGRMANRYTVGATVADVLVAVGLKRPGERTHILRGTNMSQAIAAGITTEQIAAFAGHSIPGDPLITKHYLRWNPFLAGLPARAWDYVPHLGTPDEIEALAREALRSGEISFDRRSS